MVSVVKYCAEHGAVLCIAAGRHSHKCLVDNSFVLVSARGPRGGGGFRVQGFRVQPCDGGRSGFQGGRGV